LKKTELLSPAGDLETLIGVVNAKADAVYVAYKDFGARASANNFTKEELIQGVRYAHLHNVKVFVTINTLIFSKEVEKVIELCDFLISIHVDAFIVQDIGIIDLIHKRYLGVEIHASTQVNATTLEEVIKLKELGVTRVILGRETSIEEIKRIKENLDIQLEIFIQGALCFSYSGNCYFSRFVISDRSGNRGSCAQFCRREYRLLEEKNEIKSGFLLSMKDLFSLSRLDEILSLGIDSLKIEGRLRRKEYAVSATILYRKKLDDMKTDVVAEINNLKGIFNREFTDGILFKSKDLINENRPNHQGIKIGTVVRSDKNRAYIKLTGTLRVNDGYRILSDTKDIGDSISRIIKDSLLVKIAYAGDIVAIDIKDEVRVGSSVLLTKDSSLDLLYSEYFEEKYNHIPIQGMVVCFVNKKLSYEISYKNIKVKVESLLPVSLAINKKLDSTLLYSQFDKLGGTHFYHEKLKINTDNNSFVPLSMINELRRNAISELEELLLKRDFKIIDYPITPDIKPLKKEMKVVVSVKSKEQLDACLELGIKEIYLDKSLDTKEIKTHYLVQRVGFTSFKDKVVANNISQLGSNTIISEYLPVTNYLTYLYFEPISERVTISREFEDKDLEIFVRDFVSRFSYYPNLEYIVYDNITLMVSKVSIFDDINYSKEKKYYLESGIDKYQVLLDKDSNTLIYSSKKRESNLSLDSLKNLGLSSIRINLLDEKKEDIKRILNKYIVKD
jgi:putative protease